MRRPARILAVAACALPLTLAAGCGGDDGADPAAYREQANAVCAEADKAYDDLAAAGDPSAFIPGVLAAYQAEIDSLAELDPPDDLRSGHETILRLLRQAHQQIEANAESLASAQPGQPAPGSTNLAAIGQQRRSEAREMGLEDCAGQIL